MQSFKPELRLYNPRMPIVARYPVDVALSVLVSLLSDRRRSFRRDALRITAGIPIEHLGGPPSPPLRTLFVVNHYSRPGLPAWWGPLAIAACVPGEMHWTMTAAWTFADPIRARLCTPVSEWLFARLARVYGFTTMPPMPPRPADSARRAAAVRAVLRAARRSNPPIGLAPEGMDSPDGRLTRPPAGVGRFIAHLAEAGYTTVPVGVFERPDRLCVRFGAPLALPAVAGIPAAALDATVSHAVMTAIGALLPKDLVPQPPFRLGGDG